MTNSIGKGLIIFLIIISFTSVVSASWFRPETPPPIVINNQTNLTVGSINMSGDLYMNNNTIWNPVLFNASFINYIINIVNGSFIVTDNMFVGENLTVNGSICLNGSCIEDWDEINPTPRTYTGTINVVGGLGSTVLYNLNLSTTSVRINRSINDNFFDAKIYDFDTSDRLGWLQSKSYHDGVALSKPAGQFYNNISIVISDADEDGTYSYTIEGEYYG